MTRTGLGDRVVSHPLSSNRFGRAHLPVAFANARQYRESFDVYGSLKSFEWPLVEGQRPLIHAKGSPEPEIPAPSHTFSPRLCVPSPPAGCTTATIRSVLPSRNCGIALRLSLGVYDGDNQICPSLIAKILAAMGLPNVSAVQNRPPRSCNQAVLAKHDLVAYKAPMLFGKVKVTARAARAVFPSTLVQSSVVVSMMLAAACVSGCGKSRSSNADAVAMVDFVVPVPPAAASSLVLHLVDGGGRAQPLADPRPLDPTPLGAREDAIFTVEAPIGTHVVRARALDVAGLVLYEVFETIEVTGANARGDGGSAEEDAGVGEGDAGVPAESGRQTFRLILERGVGDVDVVVAPPLLDPSLRHRAMLGPFAVDLVADSSGNLAGQLTGVPSGRAQRLVVDSVDRAGTVLFQGGLDLDVDAGQRQVARPVLGAMDLAATLPGAVLTADNAVVDLGKVVQLKLRATVPVSGANRRLSHAVVHFGDGTHQQVALAGEEQVLSLEHTYRDPGAQVVSAAVFAADGHVAVAGTILGVGDSRFRLARRFGYAVVEAVGVPEDVDALRATLGSDLGTRPEDPSLLLTRTHSGFWSGVIRHEKGGRRSVGLSVRFAGAPSEIAGVATENSFDFSGDVAYASAPLRVERALLAQGGSLDLGKTTIWLDGSGSSFELAARLRDASGSTLDAQALEWLSTDARRVSVAALGEGRARITAHVDTASVQVVARSRTNPALLSPPVTVVVAKARPDVAIVRIPSAAIAYSPGLDPTQESAAPDVRVLDRAGHFLVGSFDGGEITAHLDRADGVVRPPFVLRGPPPAEGFLVVMPDGSHGRVAHVETRDAHSLVLLEGVPLGEVFQDLEFSYDHEDLLKRGFVAPPAVPVDGAAAPAAASPRRAAGRTGKSQQKGVATDRFDSAAAAVAARKFPSCKFDGSFAGLELKVADVLPNFVPVMVARVRKNLSDQHVFEFRSGFRASLSVRTTLTIQPGVIATMECALTPPIPLRAGPRVVIPPIPIPIGFDFGGEFAPSIRGQVRFNLGARITAEAGFKVTADEVGGLDWNLSTGDAQPYSEFGPPVFRSDWDLWDDAVKESWSQVRLNATLGLFIKGDLGVGLAIGLPLPLLKILSVRAGGEAQIVWENAPYVLQSQKSGSTVNISPYAEVNLENKVLSDALNRVGLKRVLNTKLFTFRGVPRHYYRPLKDAGIFLDGVRADTVVGVTRGQSVAVTVKTEFDPYLDMRPEDDPPRVAHLWWTKGMRFERLEGVELPGNGVDGFTGTLTITDEMCSRFDVEGTQLHVVGYNRMLGKVDTPGYVGSLALTCKDEVTYFADEIVFPTPDGFNMAIVGNVRAQDCSDVAHDVRLVASVNTKPDNSWTVEDARFFLDGELLATASGPSPLRLPAVMPNVVRDLAPGKHVFSLQYTARRGAETRTEKNVLPFTVRLKPRDSSLDCDSPTTTPYRPVTVAAQGPIAIPGPARHFPTAQVPRSVRVAVADARGGTGGVVPQPGAVPVGTSSGDPHLATADGITYSTMTLGEFVLARATSADTDLEVQTRQARLPGFAEWASFNVAAAVRAHGHVYEVRLPAIGAATTDLEILMDGQPLLLPAGTYTLDGALVKVDPAQGLEIAVEEPAATPMTMRHSRVRIGKRPDNELVRANTSEPAVSLHVSMTTPPLGRYWGLLGRPDGMVDNELTMPDGTVTKSLSQFIETWRVRERAASLFSYPAGQGPETFNLVQDRRPPTPAELGGAGGSRNFIAEVEFLLRQACHENPALIDPAFVLQQAYELAAGRTPQNMIENGLCFDERVYAAGHEPRQTAALSFAGKVTLSHLGGAGAAGMNVLVSSPTLGLKLCDGVTDASGVFSCGYLFERPDETTLDLFFRISGHGAEVERRITVPTPVSGGTDRIVQDFIVALEKVVRVRGEVKDPDGRPLPRAFVRVVLPYHEYQADDGGRFDIVLPVDSTRVSTSLRVEATNADASQFGGTDLLVESIGPGVTEVNALVELRANEAPPPVRPSSGSAATEVVSRRMTFVGKVTDRNGVAVEGATVRVKAAGFIAGGGCSTTSSSDGRFICSGELLATGPFAVDAEAHLSGAGRRTVRVTVESAELPAPGEARTKLVPDLAIAPTRVRVAGRVTADAMPVAGVAVVALLGTQTSSGVRGTTSTSGDYELELFVADDLAANMALTLRALWNGEGGLSNTAETRTIVGGLIAGDVNQRSVDITFTNRAFALVGRVLNQLGGDVPVPGARVSIRQGATLVCVSESDERGQYACPFSTSSATLVALRYEVDTVGALVLDPVVVDPTKAAILGATPFVQDLKVTPTTLRLSGTVARADGTAVPTAEVSVLGGITAALPVTAGTFEVYFAFANDLESTQFDLRATDGTALVSLPIETTLARSAVTHVVRSLVFPAGDVGKLLWTYEIGSELYGEGSPAVGPDGSIHVLVHGPTGGARLQSINPGGTAKWHHDFNRDDSLSDEVVVGPDGALFLRSADAGLNLHAIGANGQKRFTFQNGDLPLSAPLPLPGGGVVAILGRKLVNVLPSGAEGWTAVINDSSFADGAVVRLDDGSFRVVTARGYGNGIGSWAHVAATGEVNKLVPLEEGFQAILAVEGDGTLIAGRPSLYEGPSGGSARIDASGQVVWSVGSDDVPARGADGNLRFVQVWDLAGANDGLVVLSPAGTLLFSKSLERGRFAGVTSTNLSLALTDDVSDDGGKGNLLRAYDNAGSDVWTFRTGGEVEAPPFPGPAGSTIMLVDRRRVVSVNADGSPRWQFDGAGDEGSTQFSAVLRNGVLYLARGRKVFAIRP